MEMNSPPTTRSRHDELAIRYDADPDAIEWAQGKILRAIEQAEKFEGHANDAGSLVKAARWHLVTTFMRTRLIGGDGCVVAAFDWRLPKWTQAVAKDVKSDD